jgi:glycosyltransferase involved in cell wall biosynthesis
VKGGDRLLWAFGEVAKKRAGVSLVLCGPGGRRFADMVRLLGLEDRVELNDHVPYAKALSLIRGCLFYAQISRYESFGMAILESMALGKTVLVSDTVGLGPYLRHGGNAHVVDPMDLRAVSAGLGKLVSDEAYRNRLARAAGETARELSWPRVAPGYEALYRRAAASA